MGFLTPACATRALEHRYLWKRIVFGHVAPAEVAQMLLEPRDELHPFFHLWAMLLVRLLPAGVFPVLLGTWRGISEVSPRNKLEGLQDGEQ